MHDQLNAKSEHFYRNESEPTNDSRKYLIHKLFRYI